MNAEHPPKRSYSKEELRRMSLSRHASDGALLNVPDSNGERGDYDGDRLAPTAAQIETIRREHESSVQDVETYHIPEHAPSVGKTAVDHVLMRANAAYDELAKTQEQLNAEGLNIENLRIATEDFLRSYELYYGEQVPPASTNERTRIRGKLKTESVTTAPQIDNMALNGQDFTFSTKLTYKPGETRNTLERTDVRVKPKGGEDLDADALAFRSDTFPTLSAQYSADGHMEKLSLNRIFKNVVYDRLFDDKSMTQGSIGEFIGVLGKFDDKHRTGFDIDVHLTGELPKVAVTYRWNTMPSHEPGYQLCEYVYDASSNEFALHNSINSANHPEAMCIEDYFELLGAMLSLAPVTKVPIN